MNCNKTVLSISAKLEYNFTITLVRENHYNFEINFFSKIDTILTNTLYKGILKNINTKLQKFNLNGTQFNNKYVNCKKAHDNKNANYFKEARGS